MTNANEDIFNADEIKKRNERNQKKQPKKKTASNSNRRKSKDG